MLYGLRIQTDISTMDVGETNGPDCVFHTVGIENN
jgi:hypothetical protein